jgi:hypothetical protein
LLLPTEAGPQRTRRRTKEDRGKKEKEEEEEEKQLCNRRIASKEKLEEQERT